MKEAQQPLFTRRELSLSRRAEQSDHADSAASRGLIHGRELVVDVDRPTVIVPGSRSVPGRIGDDLSAGTNAQPVGPGLHRPADGIAAGPQVAPVGTGQLLATPL